VRLNGSGAHRLNGRGRLFVGFHRRRRSILDLIPRKQRFLALLLREEESDDCRSDEDCNDARRVRPLVAVEKRRLRCGGDLTCVLRVLLCDRLCPGKRFRELVLDAVIDVLA
jgi:hypothetical protein